VEIVLAQAGQTLGVDIESMASQKLAALARREGLGDSMELLRMARTGADPALAAAIVDAVLPHETHFFRDRALWKALRNEVLPTILSRMAGRSSPIRIWSAGCAYGQEVYSFSMAVAELWVNTPGMSVEIVGTDISERAIGRARSGIYTQFEVQRGLPIQMLLKHFEREEQAWRINNAPRRMTRFARHNLLADMAPLGMFDVISCQQVLPGFETAKRDDVLSRMVGQLNAGGLLLVGPGDELWSRAHKTDLHSLVSPWIFQRTIVQRQVA
jgi:chemotaxis protein methyltransferase CheR